MRAKTDPTSRNKAAKAALRLCVTVAGWQILATPLQAGRPHGLPVFISKPADRETTEFQCRRPDKGIISAAKRAQIFIPAGSDFTTCEYMDALRASSADSWLVQPWYEGEPLILTIAGQELHIETLDGRALEIPQKIYHPFLYWRAAGLTDLKALCIQTAQDIRIMEIWSFMNEDMSKTPFSLRNRMLAVLSAFSLNSGSDSNIMAEVAFELAEINGLRSLYRRMPRPDQIGMMLRRKDSLPLHHGNGLGAGALLVLARA